MLTPKIATPTTPRIVNSELIENFEKIHPHFKGIGDTMIELGLWVIDENFTL